MKLQDTIHRGLPTKLAIFAIFLLCVWFGAGKSEVDLGALLGNSEQIAIVMQRLMQPDWSYLPTVIPAMIQTVQMAIAGTFIGVVFALPVSFLATTLITNNRLITGICRGILNIIRTIPDLLLASLLVAIFGIGTFTGMLSIAIFTFGMTSKLYYEAIDTIDLKPVDSLISVGASKTQTARFAIIPQILPNVVSYSMYAFEINVRASTVLGYVGAGGIGLILNHSMSLMRYDRVSVIILAILVVVAVIDIASSWARRRFL
ncbi:MAG: phosphonate ABC transporter, permease protein PhnE [Microbacteriaceae bacterium]